MTLVEEIDTKVRLDYPHSVFAKRDAAALSWDEWHEEIERFMSDQGKERIRDFVYWGDDEFVFRDDIAATMFKLRWG